MVIRASAVAARGTYGKDPVLVPQMHIGHGWSSSMWCPMTYKGHGCIVDCLCCIKLA